MDIAGKFKEFITKLQNLPDNRKKIVLWTIVGILAVAMGYFWVKGAINSFNKIGESVSQIKLPDIQTPAMDTLQTTSPTNENLIQK